MTLRVPDFFIAGAPKCGTTSLFRYLEANDAISLSAEKEPGFFCADLPFRHVTAEQDYADLFANAAPSAVVGEASPWYLYSRTAVPAILQRNPRARFIVLLRSPPEMAVSLYHHHRRAGIEPEPTFEAAWRAQREDHLSSRSFVANRIAGFPYADVCSLGQQLRQLVVRTGRNNVLALLLEDLSQRPADVLAQVSAFLGVPFRPPERFTAHNASRVNRSVLLTRTWYAATRRGRAYWLLKRTVNMLGMRPGRWLFDRVITREAGYPPPSPWLIEAMRTRLAPEVALLEQLTGRRLGHWLPAATSR